MKSILKYLMMGAVALTTAACQDLEDINVDPNNQAEVPSHMLMCGAEKYIMDVVYDNWFSGRQCLLYAQYWSQRNYTEEDRYQIRESTNNSYFGYLYRGVANLNKVIELNTDAATAATNSAYGANCNQIAAARILKAWTLLLITDTWGDVPYADISQLEDGVLNCRYDDQATIYASLLADLAEAVGMIDESKEAFSSGDIIYGGDASKWKRFGNSLRCRIAIHTSKVDPQWKSHIAAAIESGVFESNDDAAGFKYSTSGTDYTQFYYGTYVSGRNDFTIAKPFADILKGQPDTLNAKSHPWEGVEDPRLPAFTTANASTGLCNGFAYGTPTSLSSAARTGTPNWYYYPPCHLDADFTVPLMTFAELKFIMSEYKGYDADEYKAGVEASLDYWSQLAGYAISDAARADYIDKVSASVDAEAVALQKYIDLYINGTEAWTELRRTGYPEQLLRPGEVTMVYNGTPVAFEPLSEVKGDIIARVKYPTDESSLNGANWADAVARLTDGTNNYYSKMFYDVRTSTYDHPANK